MKKVSEELWYRQMRWEHKKRKDTGYYAENLGETCVNCGDTENIVYHHIVPIHAGGTNNIRNIVPLCTQCHRAVHGSRSRENFRNRDLSGRPSTATENEWDEVLSEYAKGIIGQSEALERLNKSPKSHLVDATMYRDFLKKHEIKKIKNLVDIKQHHHKIMPGEIVGYIELENGKRVDMVR